MHHFQNTAMASILLIQADTTASDRSLAVLGTDPSLAVCGIARTLAEARAALARRVPDLVIADLCLPDGTLATLLRELRPGRSHVLGLTLSVRDPALLGALRAGVDACLTGDTPAERVHGVALRMLAGESPLAPDLARRLLGVFDTVDTRPSDARQGGWQALGRAEFEVLRCAAEGLSRGEIAERLGLSPPRVGQVARAIHRRLHRVPRPGRVRLSLAAAGCR